MANNHINSSKRSIFSFRNLVYLYISIPPFLFFFWLKPVLTVCFACVFLAGLFFILKDNDSDEHQKDAYLFNKTNLLLIFSISLAWCYLAGQGGFFYQSSDHYIRNGIFRDLILFKWPVCYEKTDAMLTYYVGHWLFPALFGKIAFIITNSISTAWLVAKIALLLWSTLGIMLVFILLCKIFSLSNNKAIVFCCLFFIFFSGLDILGIYVRNGRIPTHLEWWAENMQYSSFTTCMFWVYNQCISVWLATLLFFYEGKVKNYAFIGLCILITSPIPLVGLFPFYVASGIFQFIKTEKGSRHKFFLQSIFSPQNIIACFTILPIVALYYFNNAAVANTPAISSFNRINNEVVGDASAISSANILNNDTVADTSVIPSSNSFKTLFPLYNIYTIALFYLFEFFLYVLVIFKQNKKSFYIWVLTFMLLVCPFIHIGHLNDFSMRASIPSLILLMVLVFKTFLQEHKNQTLVSYLIIVIFAFGTLTPTMEYLRAFKTVKQEKTIFLECLEDDYDSLGEEFLSNFMSHEYEKSFFYKYLCKHNSKNRL